MNNAGKKGRTNDMYVIVWTTAGESKNERERNNLYVCISI